MASLVIATPAYAATTEDVARDYVSTHAGQLGVLSADVADLSLLSSYKTSGTGVTHVSLGQRHAGYNVLGSQVTVNVGRDGKVVYYRADREGTEVIVGKTPEAPEGYEVARVDIVVRLRKKGDTK